MTAWYLDMVEIKVCMYILGIYIYMLILVLFYLRLDLHNSLVTDTSNKKTRLSSLKQVNSKI